MTARVKVLFSIQRRDHQIILTGDLDAGCEEALRRFFVTLPQRAYEVVATDLSVNPAGVECWIRATEKWLPHDRPLAYGQSQLAMILEDESTYKHPSIFADQYS